jgi:hypothetical protein
MNRLIATFISAIALVGATAAIAQSAQTPFGEFGDWKAYVSTAEGSKLCFVAAQPQRSSYSQSISGRDPAFFMVTSSPARNLVNETSTIIGYAFKANSPVTIDIAGNKYEMFTVNDTAWMSPEGNEAALVKAMIAGASMSVQGMSSRGTTTTDVYSLSGITAALDAIARECGA